MNGKMLGRVRYLAFLGLSQVFAGIYEAIVHNLAQALVETWVGLGIFVLAALVQNLSIVHRHPERRR